MMLKEKSSPWARMKYLYVLPVAAITLTFRSSRNLERTKRDFNYQRLMIFFQFDAKEVNNSLMDVDTAQKQ